MTTLYKKILRGYNHVHRFHKSVAQLHGRCSRSGTIVSPPPQFNGVYYIVFPNAAARANSLPIAMLYPFSSLGKILIHAMCEMYDLNIINTKSAVKFALA